MARFDVWVPEQDRARVLDALEHLDSLDEPPLRLSVTVNAMRWPYS
jgi:hypothetical protein